MSNLRFRQNILLISLFFRRNHQGPVQFLKIQKEKAASGGTPEAALCPWGQGRLFFL